MTTPATQTLAGYIVNASFENLPSDVVEKAKLCLMDSVGCFFGGHQTPVAPGLERFSAGIAGGSTNTPCPDPVWQAFHYATLANALDLDDIYSKGHPGATVVAAGLAVASRTRSTGRELIAAIVAGYEVGCHIGMSLVNNTPRKTVHGHGTWQIFGAAAASAKLLKLNHQQAAHALAIAAVNAPIASVMKTVYGTTPTMAKNNFATAAMGGVNAAFLARAGFEGPLDVFEGDTGFWRMAGADGVDLSRLKIGPDMRYEIRDVGFKAFSCCRIIQSSVEAAVEAFVVGAVERTVHEVREIEVFASEIVCRAPFNDPEPRDIWAAQFSAPFAIAMGVLGHAAGPEWFAPSRFLDQTVRDLTAKIRLSPLRSADRSSHHHAARVRLHLFDDRVVEATADVAKGDAANPLAPSFLEEKFLRLSAARLHGTRRQQILQFLKQLELKDDLRFLLDTIRKSGGAPQSGDRPM
ncbi:MULTISPECIES: MmgE/PrpD family protein [Rhizobium/Agrobacterium group]|uniref:MmgE/PrpD family protein n=1 Tax=Rhizobium/Agrobacterium group TaxID=227290 RepID=UPI00107F1E74|nr:MULTISPECIES: MmgE/PrpD family protein [Rhizobium/Agrobacterium group]MBB4403032.1 2-methylcitrate dehydratase PrpD [Agrobacterium radiobacter]MBB5589058.1 2-methylcitrate dehydratase PrpD [Agrobacterium radiobacter]TGE86124.1 MmgE/PrpD family protein [Rhizobium sp. SEMIA 4032]